MRSDGQEVKSLSLSEFGEDGVASIPIGHNGVYKISVSSPGYMTDEDEVTIACDINRCGECRPASLIPMTENLRERSGRIFLVWKSGLMDLDLYAIQNIAGPEGGACVSKYKDGCREVTHHVTAVGADMAVFESLTIGHGHESEIVYYTVVVDLKQGDLTETVQDSNTHVMITDFTGESVRVKMTSQKSSGDRYWLVGCIGGENILTGTFTEINKFLDTPPEDGEDFCKQFVTKG